MLFLSVKNAHVPGHKEMNDSYFFHSKVVPAYLYIA